MQFIKNLFVGIFTVLLAGCTYLVPPLKAFRDTMDYYVGKPLSESRQAYISAKIKDTREVQPGVVEYYFEWRQDSLHPGTECKFVLTVEKDTTKIISWRYNGDSDYCWIAT